MTRIALLPLFLVGCPPPGTPAPAVDADCTRDEECALLPYATGCGECPPAPPFDVGTREDLDAMETDGCGVPRS